MGAPGTDSVDENGLFDRPVLVVDPGMHTSMIRRASVDAAGIWAATGSDDKTVRIWSVSDGALVHTIRMPAGPGSRGAARSVAISPDGAIVAVGGSVPNPETDRAAGEIHLFARDGDTVVRHIVGLDASAAHLAFSSDGALLAATLHAGGIRIYARDKGWEEVARDGAMAEPSYWADFSPDGRLAVTTADEIRLYGQNPSGALVPVARRTTAARPYSVAFSPDGARLAVGYDRALLVEILDGNTLSVLPQTPDCRAISGGDLPSVAWLRDGQTLLAAGSHPPALSPESPPRKSVVAWDVGGTAPPRFLPSSRTTVMVILALPDGDFLVAGGDPWWGRLGPDGTERWTHAQPQADLRGLDRELLLSSDGMAVGFGYETFGKSPARFDVGKRALTVAPAPDDRLAGPRRDGFVLDPRHKDWPTFNGKRLQMWDRELCHCGAVAPAADIASCIAIGADWTLRVFDAEARPRWVIRVQATVWATNISGDGRLLVAAHGDGTIRWYRMGDGHELLAFMPLPDRERWILWTPEGFYATEGAHTVLRWHINRGVASPAGSVSIASIPGSYRPAVLPLVVSEGDIGRALGTAMLIDHRRRLDQRIGNEVPDAAVLFVLAIGIATYNKEKASSLKLEFADRDAAELVGVLFATQRTLYRDVMIDAPLVNEGATTEGIFGALERLRLNMENRGGQDLAVVYFSGHGAIIDGGFWLLPHDVNARNKVAITASAISAGVFRDKILGIAARGRVLLLLDACHSGGAMNDGTALVANGTTLKTALMADNVTILTSSTDDQVSREDPALKHGIFTKVLLDAFTDPDADPQNVGLITANALGDYVFSRVSGMTEQRQKPDSYIKSNWTLFASRL